MNKCVSEEDAEKLIGRKIVAVVENKENWLRLKLDNGEYLNIGFITIFISCKLKVELVKPLSEEDLAALKKSRKEI